MKNIDKCLLQDIMAITGQQCLRIRAGAEEQEPDNNRRKTSAQIHQINPEGG